MPGREIDVLIRGAGPVGCALALALGQGEMRVGVLGRAAPPAAFRPVALSYASRLILERLGAWRDIPATPITSIHVSQQQGFGRVRLDAADAGVPALGYVAEYSELLAALERKARLFMVDNAPEARCVVHAEGLAPQAHEKRYAQDALVALVRTEPPSAGVAYERFTPEGPLALLPFKGRYALVWSCAPERARALLDASADLFVRQLSAAAGARAGRALDVEARGVHPLVLRVQQPRVLDREVYIGNAAQTLHPVAGQGLNLGLRDAWELARILLAATDPGDAMVLARFAALRRFDAQAAIRLTDALAAGFLGSNRTLRAARGMALTALDLLPGPRRFFARRMIYGASALP
jgi:2-octaprenyl-6-methoxyphenol hydroxylase